MGKFGIFLRGESHVGKFFRIFSKVWFKIIFLSESPLKGSFEN